MFLPGALQFKKRKKKEKGSIPYIIMSESEKRCMPPCQKHISDDDPHNFSLECLEDEHAAFGSEGECEHCDLLPIKVLCTWLAFFRDEQAASPR